MYDVKENNLSRIKEIRQLQLEGKVIEARMSFGVHCDGSTYTIEEEERGDWEAIDLNSPIFKNYEYRIATAYCVIKVNDKFSMVSETKVDNQKVYCKGTKEECIAWVEEHSNWFEEEAKEYAADHYSMKMDDRDLVYAFEAGGKDVIRKLLRHITNPRFQKTILYLSTEMGIKL